jgi:hypothetical protein
MEQQFLELYKLRYNKILSSSEIMYKTLASYNAMAMPLKKVLKEADIYIQCIVISSVLRTNEYSLDLFKQIHESCEYESVLKQVKIHKVKTLDDKIINKIEKIIEKTLTKEPFFLRVAAFFDSITKKLKPDEKTSGCLIIKECILAMLALVRNEDDAAIDLKKYNNDIKIVIKVFEK